MRKIGLGLLIVGLIGVVYFGYEAMQVSENFSVLGVDVAVSSANWTPVIFSGIVAVVGIILALIKKKG
jgi:hypothetical protein